VCVLHTTKHRKNLTSHSRSTMCPRHGGVRKSQQKIRGVGQEAENEQRKSVTQKSHQIQSTRQVKIIRLH